MRLISGPNQRQRTGKTPCCIQSPASIASAKRTPSPFFPRHPTRGRRQGHHQSRHRPARFSHAWPYRRSGGQGAPRRPPRLHAGNRHQAPARGGRRRHPSPSRRRCVARPGDHCPRRQGHHVRRHPDVRRTRRRHPLSRSRLPHLSLDDRVHRRQARADSDPRGKRLRLLGRGDALPHHARDAADDPQFAGQPHRRRHAEGRDRCAGGGPCPFPRRRHPLRRDLRPDDLRWARPRLAAHLPGDPRPPHPARRLVEDLRHDRLAHGLFGVAGAALRPCPQAGGQRLVLRQRADAVCRPCGAHRPAGFDCHHGRRVRQAAEDWWSKA